MEPEAAWRGRLWIGAGRALYTGPAGDTRPHAHHALQLILAASGSFEVQIGDQPARRFEALLVGADREHRLLGSGSLALYYVDAGSEEGRSLSDGLAGRAALPLSEQASALREALAAGAGAPRAERLGLLQRALACALGRHAASVPVSRDEKVERARLRLEAELDVPLRVADLAAGLGLRQRELSARFRRDTGLSIRGYRLWLRIQRAVAAVGEGRSLTEAAHAAGFADAAHLSRTFVRMFGVAPSASLGHAQLRRDPKPSV